MKNNKQFAVVARDGFFRDVTKIYSAHATEAAAIKAAKQHKASISGQPSQSSAMVIRGAGGFSKGEMIYTDTIRRQYPVVW